MRFVDAALAVDLIGTAAMVAVSASRPDLVARRTAGVAAVTVALACVGLHGAPPLVTAGAVLNSLGSGALALRLGGQRRRSAILLLVAGSALSAVYLVGIRWVPRPGLSAVPSLEG